MTRRIVRTGMQFATAIVLVIIFLFFVDNRYRVLPTKIHTWNPAHHAGHVVTDIQLTTCSSLNPLSSCKLPAPWVRIDKDLYLNKKFFGKAYLYVQRKKEEELTADDRVVVEVQIRRLKPGQSKDATDLDWEKRNGGIWLLRSQKARSSDSDNAVTAVDVLYGADAVDPRINWKVVDIPFLIDADAKTPEPRLSIRIGEHKLPSKPQPRVRKDGKFKIIQVSDMHLTTGLGVCRDEFPPTSHCEADPRTLEFVGAMLDLEKPDLAILSGDQVNGETTPDSQSATFKYVELFASRKIPYAIIFGNHDDEGNLSRDELMALSAELPYSLSEAGPANVDGVGNYYVEVLAKGSSSHSALTIYMLDTHAYSPDEAHYKGYDWLKPSQLAWFRQTATQLRNSAAHKEYAHMHLDMAFIHIPLPEYRDTSAVIQGSGEWREPPTAPGFNSYFKDALVENNVFAVSCGHDHANDYCSLATHSAPKEVPDDFGEEAKKAAERGKLWMCYAGGSGYGGYGGWGGYKRRVRLWEFEMGDARVETWKRIDGEDGRKDVRRVVERGEVVGK